MTAAPMTARATGAERVLVVRPDGLGDVVLAGPAVRAVAASGARVTMLCSPAGAPAAERLPGVQEVIVTRLPWIDASPRRPDSGNLQEILATLERAQPDVAVILTSSHQSSLPTALLLRLAGVARVGGISVDYPGSLLDVSIRDDPDVHEVARALSLVRLMGYALAPGDDDALRIRPRPHAVPARPDGRYVVVHPGASVPARTPPPAHWCDIVAELGAAGVDVVVTGGPGEQALTARVAAAHRHAWDLGGALGLDALLTLLAHADAVVVGNTGPAHLAAAVGTPVASVFAPTVPPARWRPWGVPHVLLGDLTVPCAGCRARRCPRPRQDCVAEVRGADVVDAVHHLTSARLAAVAR
jgi:ADP-heptose:LPS heptosyltransferase